MWPRRSFSENLTRPLTTRRCSAEIALDTGAWLGRPLLDPTVKGGGSWERLSEGTSVLLSCCFRKIFINVLQSQLFVGPPLAGSFDIRRISCNLITSLRLLETGTLNQCKA